MSSSTVNSFLRLAKGAFDFNLNSIVVWKFISFNSFLNEFR